MSSVRKTSCGDGFEEGRDPWKSPRKTVHSAGGDLPSIGARIASVNVVMPSFNRFSSVAVRSVLGLGVGLFLISAVPQAAEADTLFVPPVAGDKKGDMNDLDHQYVYTWLLTNMKDALNITSTTEITGARLTISNIRNWNSGENRLYMHLLDTAKTSGSGLTEITESLTGVYGRAFQAQDEASTSITLRDDLGRATTAANYNPTGDTLGWGSYNYTDAGARMVANGTGNTPIGNISATQTATGSANGTNYSLQVATAWANYAPNDDQTSPYDPLNNGTSTDRYSFGTTGVNYVLNFSDAYLADLRAYINNGDNFALGFDPDCHFFNDGITLEIFTGAVVNPNQFGAPEPASMVLLGSGLAALFYRRRRASKSEQA
jgi:hypothetical protein